MRRLLVLSALFLVSGVQSAVADPLIIDITNTQYSVDLIAQIRNYSGSTGFNYSRTQSQSGSDPIADSLIASFPNIGDAKAEGTVDLFSTWEHTFAGQYSGNMANAWATVAEQIAFTSATDQSGDVSIAVQMENQYTKGFVTLNDITTDAVVWTYAWNYLDAGGPYDSPWNTLPVDQRCHCFADFLVPTTLLADHLYRLDLSSMSGANKDGQVVSMAVSNLVPVPEPSAFALSTIALLLIGLHRGLPRRLRQDGLAASCFTARGSQCVNAQ